MKKQQGNTLIWLVVVIIIVGLAVWYFTKSGYKLPNQTSEAPKIMNVADLDSASKDLDNTNLNDMDSGINEVSQDSSSF